ncbi:uncharacterized protein JN550_012462 [Neoarthrinium moseri]|uniref:uncharacterized protein n=1 Tax=Neoarthrinium moseri TaxID=1658444 RepID=UPI001FDB50F7|nr:uncharacterized protein JN550_012462 [Neoarthrinium moseri]KAI1858808.1 hypothetical protein JN550_012462 [Neoarthrinium moseri]
MGAFVSVETCETHYNVLPNCSLPEQENGNQHKYDYIGEYTRGTFEADPDIAGIGILGVFLGVTCFALFISLLDIFWQSAKSLGWKQTLPREQRVGKTSFTDILETVVLACSDQQVFTGAAYALTLRYWRGCTISAYHYNVVANMMLLTCATHLMSVTIVRNYWKYPWLAFLRVICISGVFLVTGLLMVNQNAADGKIKFPTGLPAANETDSLLFLPAACFQSSKSPFVATLQNTTSSANAFFLGTLQDSTPSNFIQGWNWYIVILLFYGAAIIAEFIRFCRRGRSRPGWRGRLGARISRFMKPKSWQRKTVSFIFLIYLLGGAGISCTAVIKSGSYIFALRSWVDKSGWIALENDGNPENDATSFGQLVPIFLSALVLFTFAQTISDKITAHGTAKHKGEKPPPQEGTLAYFDPSTYNIMESGAGEMKYNGHSIATPGTIDLESAQPWPANKPMTHITAESGKPSSSTSIERPEAQHQISEPMLAGNAIASAIAFGIDPVAAPATPGTPQWDSPHSAQHGHQPYGYTKVTAPEESHPATTETLSGSPRPGQDGALQPPMEPPTPLSAGGGSPRPLSAVSALSAQMIPLPETPEPRLEATEPHLVPGVAK